MSLPSAPLVALALWWSGANGAPTAPTVADELSRLAGQTVQVAPDGASYLITDVAGEGPPRVGVVERRGRALWLVDDHGGAVRLTGPLAVPRIAGPGYRVWVVGSADGDALHARRLGVLRPPPQTGRRARAPTGLPTLRTANRSPR